jgi:diguanylate cyclase (GGDEF)-like protein
MSLSKQLLILISALFLMIFSVNFVLSVNNIRSYLEGEAQVHAQDTATSLGLSLSPNMENEADPIIETMMNAIFDMGYYQEIKLVNIDNKELVRLTNDDSYEGVPGWFVNNFHLKTAMAESEISSGWNVTGVVSVTISPGYAYQKLFEQVKNSFYYSLLALVFSICLLLIVLRITLSPLKKIDQLALTIADGRFEQIESLPWTTEVRNVTASMNMMSRKIGGIIRKLNAKLNDIGKKLQQDDLTGLNKKSSFETDIKHLFTTDVDAYIFMIKIDGLSSLVKELGDDAIDQFLKDFSQILSTVSEQYEHGSSSVYRFVGSEFVLLMQQVTLEQTEQLAKLLSASFAEVGEKYKKPDIAHIGIVPLNPTRTTADILLAASEAYEQAQLIGENSYYIRTSINQAKDIAEWKALVFSIVDNKKYNVSFVGQIESFQTGQCLMEEAFTQIVDEKGGLIPIGVFVSIAEKFSKIVDLDKGIILKVIDHIKTEQIQYDVAVNLSTRTIKNSDFRVWLAGLLKQNQSISQQLVFSLSAYAVAKEIEVYKEFIDYAHSLNAKIIIKRFETQSMSLDIAKDLKPDFIRLARDIGNGVATDERKNIFVETMQAVAELLDISILAENVLSEEDYACVKSIGITGASR